MELKLQFARIDESTAARLLLSTALGIDPLLEIPVAAALSDMSVPEAYARIREHTFPQPVQVGLRKRAIHLSQVRAWNENPTPSLRRLPKSEPVSGNGTTGNCK